MNDQVDSDRYFCLAGHEIPAGEIPAASEVVVLDGAAKVRVCREHGCPIAIHREAPARASGAGR